MLADDNAKGIHSAGEVDRAKKANGHDTETHVAGKLPDLNDIDF
jgi:hypothetical protein